MFSDGFKLGAKMMIKVIYSGDEKATAEQLMSVNRLYTITTNAIRYADRFCWDMFQFGTYVELKKRRKYGFEFQSRYIALRI